MIHFSCHGCYLDGCSLDGYIKPDNKTLLIETGCLSIFGSPPCVTDTPPWLLRPVKVSTSSELYPDTRYFFWMLRHPIFQFALTCDLWDVIPRQRSPTLVPREAEDFPRGGNHSKHVPLPTYLAWLQPLCSNS